MFREHGADNPWRLLTDDNADIPIDASAHAYATVVLFCSICSRELGVIMDAITTSKYEAKAKHVRAALKQWEGDWAKTHNGKKPGREDIKNNLDIGETILQS